MRQTGKEKKIPFTLGFYGGLFDTYDVLLTNNFIPMGHFFGNDVVVDESGFLRARPVIGRFIGSATQASSPAAVFKLAGDYYTIPRSGVIKHWSSGTWNSISSSPTYTDKMNVDYISKPASVTPLAIVSTGTGSQAIAAIEGTTCTVASGTYTKGMAAPDEGRLFCINGNLVYYSTRFDYTTGYNNTAGDEWLTIPEVCDDLVSLKNVAGSLYVIQSSSNTGRIYIWKKVQTYSDPLDLLDFTSFQQVLGVDDAAIVNGNDGIGVLGGNICFWANGSGLNIVSDRGTKVVSQNIQAWNPIGLLYNCIVATDQRSKKIFVKEENSTTTFVYDMVTETWSNWNVNVTCKGYGQPGGMFGTALNWGPAYVGGYPTDTNDTTIVPVMYTPVIDFGAPDMEKFLTRIDCSARGVTEIKVYTRLTPNDNFALIHTLTSPGQITHLAGESRFGECYLKISGNPLFLLKELKLIYDLGDTIKE